MIIKPPQKLKKTNKQKVDKLLNLKKNFLKHIIRMDCKESIKNSIERTINGKNSVGNTTSDEV